MNIRPRALLCFTILCLLNASVCPVGANGIVYSPALGCVRISCPAGSDTVVSVPFHWTPRWSGQVAAPTSVPTSGRIRILLSPAPVFAANELTAVPHFLVSRQSSNAEGRHFPVVAHSGAGVDIVAQPGDLGGLTTGGWISLIPAWTLNALFPPGSQSAMHLSTGRLGEDRKSELLFFDTAAVGTRLAPSRRFFVNSQGWFDSRTYAPAGLEIIAPGQAFVIRHPTGVTATEFIPSQQIYGGAVVQSVRVSQGRAQDTVVSLPRPLPVVISGLGLGPDVFEESSGTAQGGRKDQLLVFNNLTPGLNKAPAATYFKTSGQWRQDTSGFPLANQVEVKPGQALLIRKAPGVTATRVIWSNAAFYNLNAP